MPAFTRNLLIVKFGALGDVVRTAYLLPALAAKYPDARIWWLTSNGAVELLRFNPHIYQLATPTLGFEALAAVEFEFAVSLDDEREVLARLAQLRVGRVIGARLDGEQRAYCEASAPWFGMGLISRHGKQRADELKRLNTREHQDFLEGMLDLRIDRPSFFNSPTLEARVRTGFAADSFHVGLNSGSGARWPAKQLRLPEAIELTRRLSTAQVGGRPVKVWLLGGREEASRHAEIRAAVPSPQVVDPGYDQNLLEFAARVRALDFLITSDSLALHLGVSQQVPNLSFYAPTSAAEIGTFGSGTKVCSTTPDYCNYRPDADNSPITADRLWDAFRAAVSARPIGRA
jgi:heptosyltransferase-2